MDPLSPEFLQQAKRALAMAQMKKITFILLITVGILLTFGLLMRDSHPNPISMLKQNPSVRITSFNIYGNVALVPYAIRLTNAETLGYLTTVFREADDTVCLGVWTCRGRLTLNNGYPIDVKLVLCESNANPQFVTVGVETGLIKDEKFYTVTLSSPLPTELLDAVQNARGGNGKGVLVK